METIVIFLFYFFLAQMCNMSKQCSQISIYADGNFYNVSTMASAKEIISYFCIQYKSKMTAILASTN